MSCGRRIRRTFMASIMLVAFASRLLIPPGFMPASGRPFLMEICWDGVPTNLLAQVGLADVHALGMESMGMDPMPTGDGTSHQAESQGAHHSGSPSRGEHCVFGTASNTGPTPHLPLLGDLYSTQPLRTVAFASVAGAVRVVHLPQPRAPPSRLS